MTFAKLPRLSLEDVARRLTVDQLSSSYPTGCACWGGVEVCGYCKNFNRIYRRTKKLLTRMRPLRGSEIKG